MHFGHLTLSKGNENPGTLSHVTINNKAGEKSPPNASMISTPTSTSNTSSSEMRKKTPAFVRRSKSFQNGAMRRFLDKGNGLDEESLKGVRRDNTPFVLTCKRNEVYSGVSTILITVEPLNKGHIGLLSLTQKLSLSQSQLHNFSCP